MPLRATLEAFKLGRRGSRYLDIISNMEESDSGARPFIRMFGGLTLEYAGRVRNFSAGPTAVLLARLACAAGTEVPRDSLAVFLWPDDEVEEGRAKLRQRLFALNKEVEKFLQFPLAATRSDRDSISLDRSFFQTDVGLFRQFTSPRTSDKAAAEHIEILQEAVLLYRGPFLPNFYQDFFLDYQQRLADEFWNVLSELVSLLIRSGRSNEAVGHARRMSQIDPYSEEAAQLLISALSNCGRLGEAIEHFNVFRKLIHVELGTDISLEAPRPVSRGTALPMGATVAHPCPSHFEADPQLELPTNTEDKDQKTSLDRSSSGRRRMPWFAVAAAVALVGSLVAFIAFLSTPGLTEPLPIRSFHTDFSNLSDFVVQYDQAVGSGFKGPHIENHELVIIDDHLGEAAAVWLKKPVLLENSVVNFRFRIENPPDNPGDLADGFTLCFQSLGTRAIGGHGGSLGYAGLPKSCCLAIRLFNQHSKGRIFWGFDAGGNGPETNTPIDALRLGHEYAIELRLNGKDLAAKMFDGNRLVSSVAASRNFGSRFNVRNRPVWIGFTGGTGMGFARVQVTRFDILQQI